MKKKALLMFIGIAVFGLSFAMPAAAHFQMVYTPEAALAKGTTVDLKLVFTHPFEAGHTMDMGTPEAFYVIHKEKKTDLKATLKPINWTSLENQGKAFETSYKARRMGDHIFVLVPAPYLDPGEGIYMQQITKMIVNVGGAPTGWDEALGLPAEIVPLDKPYALYTGMVFRGIVMSDGKPVPYAEVEVEYLNHEPLMEKNAFAEKGAVEAPQDAFVTMGIKADAQGVFTFGIPRAGWWGFAALGAGPEKEFNGKEYSQDALIWIKAVDMK